MTDTYTINLNDSDLTCDIDIELPLKELDINKSAIGDTPEAKLKENIIESGRKNPYIHKFLIQLAVNGFFLVDHDPLQGISIFKKLDDFLQFKSNFTNKDIMLWNNTYYILEDPLEKESTKNNDCRLLVLFSSIADSPFASSIERRCFFRNWDKVQRYIPKNTYVLRIADIGGVVGSFYMNSKFDPHFSDKVQQLIKKISLDNNINKKNIILYGASKGGSAALYHGIIGNYNTVSIDPIVTDEYYIKNKFDSHFTVGAFEKTKDEIFADIFDMYNRIDNINIVTSENSPQFKYIRKFLNKKVHFFIFNNTSIKEHQDVSPNSLVFYTALMNSIWYGIYNNSSFITMY